MDKLIWLWQRSQYAWSKFHRHLNMPPVLSVSGRNMARCEYIQGLHRVLNMLWKCLNMCEYTLIMLNMLEYTWIYLNKQSSEYARLVNVSDAVRSIRSLYKLLSSYRDRGVFRRLSNIKNGAFCKKNNTWVQPHNQEVFSASEVSWN